MSITDLVVFGVVVSMFASFMVALGGVAWWSEQPARPARARARPSGQSTHAVSVDSHMGLAA